MGNLIALFRHYLFVIKRGFDILVEISLRKKSCLTGGENVEGMS